MDSDVILAILATAAASAVGYWRLYRRYRRTIGKVTFLFNAIDNLDFSFRFPEEGRDRVVNESLNRIRRILEQARTDLMERERFYEQIINAVSTGIMVVDERGSVLQYNEAALRLLGTEIITFESQVKERLSSDNFSTRETSALLHNQKVRIIAFSDIRSELSSHELESWTKLIRVLTHEIMNTVAPITSLSETLSHKAGGNEVRKGLSVIHSTGKQLLNFVESYRRMTLIPRPQPRLFYVKPFLERLMTISSEYSRQTVASLTLSDADLLLYADESLIAHVVTNLLKNAIEAGATSITLSAYTMPDDSICIDIGNNGKPIPVDETGQIFVPFFTTKSTGYGIGLSISRQIMKQSGGSIELVASDTATTLFRLRF
ncbi:ATP-binding protein [bacterium]|nr:ATP-binding protein [bacterium]